MKKKQNKEERRCFDGKCFVTEYQKENGLEMDTYIDTYSVRLAA